MGLWTPRQEFESPPGYHSPEFHILSSLFSVDLADCLLWCLGDWLCAQKLSLLDFFGEKFSDSVKKPGLEKKFPNELSDSQGRPRLNYARSHFLGYSDIDPDLEGLQKFYIEWRDYDECIVVQKQSENLRINGKIYEENISSWRWSRCCGRSEDNASTWTMQAPETWWNSWMHFSNRMLAFLEWT